MIDENTGLTDILSECIPLEIDNRLVLFLVAQGLRLATSNARPRKHIGTTLPGLLTSLMTYKLSSGTSETPAWKVLAYSRGSC